MEKERLMQLFRLKLGNPDNEEKLLEYISFCLYKHNDYEDYYEKHHILPRAVFPEHTKDNWNISCLSYENHVLGHFLLAEAYLNRKFSRTLNFLKNKTEDEVVKLKKILSEISKKWWKDLTEEEYDARCLMYSTRMKKMMQNGSEFHKKVCDGVNEYYKNNPHRKEELKKFFKDLWKNKTKEEYAEWCSNMKWNEDRRTQHKKYMEEKYQNSNFKELFDKKMKEVNSNINKRKDASIKLKEKWKDPNFIDKMNKRKPGSSNSSKMKEKWKDPVWKEYMLNQRKIKRKLKNETK
jgi:hypothetical protein